MMLFQSCHGSTGMGGLVQWCWPDGRGLLEQPQTLAEGFRVLRAAYAAEAAAKRKPKDAVG